MTEQKNEKWLDEMISKSINTEKPRFDTEQWKQKYAGELELLKSQAKQPSRRLNIWHAIYHSHIARFAAAAVFVLVVLLFVVPINKDDGTQVAQSPAEMLTEESFSKALEAGGMEGFEQQCDKVNMVLWSSPMRISGKEFAMDIDQ